jgi:Xaa-Pro aminopeptidase
MDDPAGLSYPRFSDLEYQRRSKLVRRMLERKNLDGCLIYNSSTSIGTVHYLSNYLSWRPTYLIYPLASEPTLILHFYNHIPCAKEMSIVSDVQWHRNDPVRAVVKCLRRKKLDRSRLGVVGLEVIPYSHMVGIRKELPRLELVDVSEEYNWIRWVRSSEEIQWFRKSAGLTDAAVYALEERVRPGLTEHDLQRIIHDAFLGDAGQLGVAFISSTSMSSPDRYVPWQFPTSRRIGKGDVIISEITVAYYGYGTQIHRPFAVGREPTPQYKKLFDVALECFERVSKVLRPGATTKDVLNASSVIEENGLTVFDSLVHGEGGGHPELGTRSSAHTRQRFKFRENMVVVIQPQPVTPNLEAGLQLGAATVITPNGAKSLHEYPFKFPVCRGG